MFENQCDYCELQELGGRQDFHFDIAKLIENEVETRVKKEIEGIDAIRESKQLDINTIVELKKKVRSLEETVLKTERKAESSIAETKKACKAKIDQIQTDALKSLFGGITVGQEVYRVEDGRVHTVCKSCDGKGRFDAEVNGLKVTATCKECQGSGKHRINGRIVDSMYVGSAVASLSSDGEVVAMIKKGFMDYSGWYVKDIFLNREEAQRIADKYNAPAIERYQGGKFI